MTPHPDGKNNIYLHKVLLNPHCFYTVKDVEVIATAKGFTTINMTMAWEDRIQANNWWMLYPKSAKREVMSMSMSI